MAESTAERYPTTTEANLLVAVLLLVTVIGAAILALLLPLWALLVAGQLLFAVPLGVWLAARRYPLRRTLRLYPISARTAVLSVLVGVACWPVVAALVTYLAKPLEAIGPYPTIPLPTSALERIAYAFTFVVIAPLTEEPTFRGFIMQAWLRRGPRIAVLASGVLFGLMHSQIAPLLPLTMLGIVFGAMALRSGSTLSTILAHAAYNAVASVFVVVPALERPPDIALLVAALVALPVAAMLVYLFVRQHPGIPTHDGVPPREVGRSAWPTITFLIVVGMFLLMAAFEVLLRLAPALGG